MWFLGKLLILLVLWNSPSESLASPTWDELKKMARNQKLPEAALKRAWAYYQQNQVSQKLSPWIAIANMSAASNTERLIVLGLSPLTIKTYKVAHGKGSDPEHDLVLNTFSDRPGSYATPEGFHKMTDTYRGQHGLSLKMVGLESGNQNSLKRAIVLHGADYVSWQHTGRSQGCPAVEQKWVNTLITQLKDGALFYFYK